MPSCTVKCRYKQLNINNDYNYTLHKDLLYIKEKELDNISKKML